IDRTWIDTERLCRQQPKARLGPADIGRANDNRDTAVAVQPARRRSRLSACRPRSECDSHSLPGTFLSPILPGRMIGKRLQNFMRADGRPRRARGHQVTLPDGILPPELQWI